MIKKLMAFIMVVGMVLGCAGVQVMGAETEDVYWEPESIEGDVILSNKNLTATFNSNSGKINHVYTNISKSSGKWYWEIEIEDEETNFVFLYLGIQRDRANHSSLYKYNIVSAGTGRVSNNINDYEPRQIVAGDTIGVAMNYDAMQVLLYINGEFYVGIQYQFRDDAVGFCPSIGGTTSALKSKATANFGATPFKYDAPEGYLPYNVVEQPPQEHLLSVLLEEEETARLIVTDRLTDNTNYLWFSSDEEVATVDDNGKVTAIAPGLAMITAESPDGEYTDSIPVRVVPKGAAGERLAVYLDPGEEQWLYLNDDYENIEWESMEPEVVEVDDMGKLKALKKGLAIVKATYEDETYLIYVRVG